MSAAAAQADTTAEVPAAGSASMDKLKFATRTSLALTLAYLLPMAWGWSQPQTAAITVMLIAATGALSESLNKGVLRALGTVAGAAIGLSLIALFPQDRFLYLTCVSVVVFALLFLYNAYQGDSTIFMLALVVSLMVFNGGDAAGAFIYGIDRTLLTVFGVLIYSLVASFIWPARMADNSQQLAAAISSSLARAGNLLWFSDRTPEQEEKTAALQDLLGNMQRFREHFVKVRHSEDSIRAYESEWNAIFACYEKLEALLVPALRPRDIVSPHYSELIDKYDEAMANIQTLSLTLEDTWARHDPTPQPQSVACSIKPQPGKDISHLTLAAATSRAELLAEVQHLLLQLLGAINSLRFNAGEFDRTLKSGSTPSFIFFDRENLKTALRGFFTFWMATFIWIQFNPPGGFMFVTLCTALIALVSYTPVSPKLLIFLFTFGFAFALPAYVFLLPAMDHWLELALFLFGYAFIGFYLFSGPVAIFFLLGLFTLGIQNSMSYNFDVILIVILMFYMVCTLLIVSVHFPFTSKPQLLYRGFRQRFLHLCAHLIKAGPPQTAGARLLNKLRVTTASSLLFKMQQWGAAIDSRYFTGSSAEDIAAFNHACENLFGHLRAMTGPNNPYARNPVIADARRGRPTGMAAELCNVLAEQDNPAEVDRIFANAREAVATVETQLSSFLDGEAGQASESRYSDQDMADFYLYINLHASILTSIDQCRESLLKLDWQQLRETRF